MKRLALFILFLTPSFYLAYEVFILQNLNDPIKYIYTFTGATAMIILFLTTILSLIQKKINLIKYRRMIGLFGFYYAFLHMLNFVVLDMELDILFALEETLDKPFVYLGMIAFIILLLMALTSFRTLYRKYNRYHKALYGALFLATIHFIMAQKSLSIAQYFYLAAIIFIAHMKIRQRF